MDTHTVRKLKGEIDTINTELMERGTIPNPNAKQDSNQVLFAPNDIVMQKLMDRGALFESTGKGDFVMVNNSGAKNQSDNTSIQNVNAGGLTVSNQDTETQYLIASGLGR